MKIYILRHGQAESFAASDAARHLTAGGVADVQALAHKLAADKWHVDAALVSPFTRTRETFSHLSMQLAISPALVFSNELLSESKVADAIHAIADFQLQGSYENLLVVSHQPLVSSLIATLLNGSSRLAYDYPMMPASMVELECELLASGCAELIQQWHCPHE